MTNRLAARPGFTGNNTRTGNAPADARVPVHQHRHGGGYQDREANVLFVYNIPEDVSQQEIRHVFESRKLRVRRVFIKCNTRNPYSVVSFFDERSVGEALEMAQNNPFLLRCENITISRTKGHQNYQNLRTSVSHAPSTSVSSTSLSAGLNEVFDGTDNWPPINAESNGNYIQPHHAHPMVGVPSHQLTVPMAPGEHVLPQGHGNYSTGSDWTPQQGPLPKCWSEGNDDSQLRADASGSEQATSLHRDPKPLLETADSSNSANSGGGAPLCSSSQPPAAGMPTGGHDTTGSGHPPAVFHDGATEGNNYLAQYPRTGPIFMVWYDPMTNALYPLTAQLHHATSPYWNMASPPMPAHTDSIPYSDTQTGTISYLPANPTVDASSVDTLRHYENMCTILPQAYTFPWQGGQYCYAQFCYANPSAQHHSAQMPLNNAPLSHQQQYCYFQ